MSHSTKFGYLSLLGLRVALFSTASRWRQEPHAVLLCVYRDDDLCVVITHRLETAINSQCWSEYVDARIGNSPAYFKQIDSFAEQKL